MVRIAVAGKGGVGKTLIAAGTAWSLARSGITTIAIDADPSPNLALMLGLSPEDAGAIVPVSDNQELIQAKTKTSFPGVYNLSFTVDDIVSNYSVKTPAGVYLLVMGTIRQMGAGCACPANTVVRTLLHHLVAERDEAIVLDMEAGVEHLGRGTAESVDLMIVVTTADSRALLTAGAITRMAREAGIPQVMLAGNRIGNAREEYIIRNFSEDNSIPLIGLVPFDRSVAEAGIAGQSVLSLAGSTALDAIKHMMPVIKGNRAGYETLRPKKRQG